MKTSDCLAILGGEKMININCGDMFKWPIVTDEHKKAVCAVLDEGSMSAINITREFETAYAKWHGVKYGLGCNNGTAALHCAFYGLGIGEGDEVIAPSFTYWATALPVLSLRGKVIFADIEEETLGLDAADVERKITPRTKAIVVVHYASMPANMDKIMAVARKHNLKVVEDVSHAQGGLYKGKLLGTFGDVSASSLMSGKSFAIGEAGIMLTDDQKIYERALLFGHYERHEDVRLEELTPYTGIPCGGYKYRMHQASAAFGLVQLKYYQRQIDEIDRAMTYFCDKLEKIDGITPIRVNKNSGNTNAGWYSALAKYDSAAFGGLSLSKFVDALTAEGMLVGAGGNKPLHLHPVFNEMDIYGSGKRTNDTAGGLVRNVSLPVTEDINDKLIMLPPIKHDRPDVIDMHVETFKKVAIHHRDLLTMDTREKIGGDYSHRKKQAKNR